MNLDAYRLALASTGKLKLRASALLAEGGDERVCDAVVLFHEAARAEERALSALPAPTPRVRLISALEQCACYLEGLDPLAASRAWGQVLTAGEAVGEQESAALVERVEQRFTKTFREYTTLEREGIAFRLPASPQSKLTAATLRAARELHVEKVLQRFPGLADTWWARYRLRGDAGRNDDAWSSLRMAVRLEPSNAAFVAMQLLFAAHVRPRAEVDALLEATYAELERAPAEVCLLYALAEAHLARGRKDRAARIGRALDAVVQGLSREGTPDGLRRNLLAARMLLTIWASGRSGSADILHRAGLGEALVAAPGGQRGNVLDALQASARREVERSAA